MSKDESDLTTDLRPTWKVFKQFSGIVFQKSTECQTMINWNSLTGVIIVNWAQSRRYFINDQRYYSSEEWFNALSPEDQTEVLFYIDLWR